MNKVLLLAPLFGNGGIASWTKKFIKSFPNEEFCLFPVSVVATAKNLQANVFVRLLRGIEDSKMIFKSLDSTVKENPDIKILHTTTSGSLGSFRDIKVAKWCKNRNVKCVMHCRYGCIPQILKGGGWKRWIMLKSMDAFDHVWVLDRNSFAALREIPELKDKVHITPNSYPVEANKEIKPKTFKKYVFMANLFPTKGFFELIEAFKKVKFQDTELHILGSGPDNVVKSLKDACGDLLGNRIIYHGKLPNDEAVELLSEMDSLVLPTYYPGEAFPISILEAMSNGKLVISTPRAAIPDMLTATDGSRCGIIVDEQNVEQLTEAINWAYTHNAEADELCKKAYEKVYNSYRTEVVYELYRSFYRELI